MHTIAVIPTVVRRMRPGDIPPSIIVTPGTLPRQAQELCYSAELRGPLEVRYHPDQVINGRTLSIICPAFTAVTPDVAVAQMAALEAAGRLTYIHANQHRARANKAGQLVVPIIAVRRGRYGRPTYAFRVCVEGAGWLVACPERMLPCSAKVYLAVPPEVIVSIQE
ncbi:hypothetical protein K2Z83_20315 [Oscillochloris sp. ZM17-4]|uniref:hypothetical protein n=1 Tax=Oscillochloris sp. ZM17-4 TaxID=2866714 RepID=UPI001C72A8AA|nr:hypothetical protein [Oscillochloris sp. ZM17-4]MBX0330016.1 hypothetical protein [Oscillochloris sp. ZM17-4]